MDNSTQPFVLLPDVQYRELLNSQNKSSTICKEDISKIDNFAENCDSEKMAKPEEVTSYTTNNRMENSEQDFKNSQSNDSNQKYHYDLTNFKNYLKEPAALLFNSLEQEGFPFQNFDNIEKLVKNALSISKKHVRNENIFYKFLLEKNIAHLVKNNFKIQKYHPEWFSV